MPTETKAPVSPLAGHEVVIASVLTAVLIGDRWLGQQAWYTVLLVAVSLVAFWPTLREALIGLSYRHVTIELFNGLAIIASFALGEWLSGAFIALMLTAARLLGEVTKARSKQALGSLMAMRPTRIFVERGGFVIEIAPADLKHDDLIVVREGETMPVDGEVADGEAVVNEAPVTGESRPVLKVRGAAVLSPSLVLRGTLKVRATRIGADTTLERIIKLVEDAQAARVPVLRLADRFATYFLPVVIILAVGAWLVTGSTKAAIAVLVVVCADDIAVSIPLAFLAAVGAAARRGVIVNGSAALEGLGRVTAIFFDKTGTLTYGRPRVERVLIEPGITDEDFWLKVGSLEKFAKHPYAQALLDEVAARHLVPADPENFENFSGRGVRALVVGEPMLAGSRTYLNEEHVTDLPPDGDEDGVWHFAWAGRYMGSVRVNDLPRPEAAVALKELATLGVTRQVMLTGDHEDAALKVAAALGIKEVRARLLPDEKLAIIAEAKRTGAIVAMVGDGINDAPSLAAADVGIAMGQGGTAIAVETAQVVVMHDDLGRVAAAIRLSRATRRVVKGDFIIWGVSNLIGLALVFGGVLGPAGAAFYNFATDFLPLINSARIFGWQRRD